MAHIGVLQNVAQFCVAKHVSALCRADRRIILSLHSTDMLGFRQKSRHSGKRADIPAKESTFRQKPVPVAGPSLFRGAINGEGEIGET